MTPLRVLLVDDDQNKRHRVIAEISAVGGESVVVATSPSASDALSKLRSVGYDLMILDLNLPRRDGESPIPGGGLQLLDSLHLPGVNLPQHIIALSGFSDIADAQRNRFERAMWGLLYYDPATTEWADRLAQKIAYLLTAHSSPSSDHYQTDLAILTTLPNVELPAVLELPGGWSEFRVAGDDSVYYRGSFSAKRRAVSVVAACTLEMGMPSAAAMSMKVIHAFRPRYLSMCGIAAGVDANPGDLVIADQVWDYGSGKATKSADGSVSHQPAPSPLPIDIGVKAQLACFARQLSVLPTIQASWRGDAASLPLAARVGPIASGAAVLADGVTIEALRAGQRKLIAVEMELYGMFVAARFVSQPKPIPLGIKGVSDNGSASKDDKYQRYAAYTSASYLHQFACNQLFAAEQ